MIVMAEITVVRNEDQHRYEAMIDGKVAGFARFRLKPGQTIFFHTEVDPSYEGKGVGSVLPSTRSTTYGRAVSGLWPSVRSSPPTSSATRITRIL
jgi:predicted GNAT family acetyltransferase